MLRSMRVALTAARPPPAAAGRGRPAGRRRRSGRPRRRAAPGRGRGRGRAGRGPAGRPASDSMRSQASSLVQAIVRAAVGDLAHQVVGVLVAEGRRHGVLLLEQQPVAGPAGAPVQLDPHGEQQVVGGVERGLVGVPQDAPGRPRPSAGRGRRAARPGPPSGRARAGTRPRRPTRGGRGCGRPGSPATGGPACATAARPCRRARRTSAASPARWRTSSRAVAVSRSLAAEGQRLLDRAHGVAELQARVPDRVPEPVGQGADVLAALVEQQDVDVGLQGQLAGGRSRRPPPGRPRSGRARPPPRTARPATGRRRRTRRRTAGDRRASRRPPAGHEASVMLEKSVFVQLAGADADDLGRPRSPRSCRHRSCRCGRRRRWRRPPSTRSASSARTSTRTLGTKSIVYSAPR